MLLAEKRIADSCYHYKKYTNILFNEREGQIIGNIAIDFIDSEWHSIDQIAPNEPCNCLKAKTLGLPCRHTLQLYYQNGQLPISVDNIPMHLRCPIFTIERKAIPSNQETNAKNMKISRKTTPGPVKTVVSKNSLINLTSGHK
jgi:hypothetical protein